MNRGRLRPTFFNLTQRHEGHNDIASFFLTGFTGFAGLTGLAVLWKMEGIAWTLDIPCWIFPFLSSVNLRVSV